MSEPSALRVTRAAVPSSAGLMRRALDAFLRTLDVEPDVASDIVTAVGEALANAIEHAYEGGKPNDVTLVTRSTGPGTIVAEVTDRGAFVTRGERPGRGFGLRIVRSIAQQVAIETENGTTLRMFFDTRRMDRGA